jgi:hypothetical protein
VVVTDSTGAVLPIDPTLTVGESVTLVLHGFTAGEAIGVTLHSTTQTLAPATASSAGTVTYAFTMPTGLDPGAHTVVFVGATSGLTTTWQFSLVAPAVEGTTTTSTSTPAASLPFTGANTGRQLLVAVAALWSGLILLLWTRPRRSVFDIGGRHRATIATGGRHRQATTRRPA